MRYYLVRVAAFSETTFSALARDVYWLPEVTLLSQTWAYGEGALRVEYFGSRDTLMNTLLTTLAPGDLLELAEAL
ncbi:MAG: hypothetical protein ACTHMJ_04895 [Thermomicrobiales bacterium]